MFNIIYRCTRRYLLSCCIVILWYSNNNKVDVNRFHKSFSVPPIRQRFFLCEKFAVCCKVETNKIPVCSARKRVVSRWGGKCNVETRNAIIARTQPNPKGMWGEDRKEEGRGHVRERTERDNPRKTTLPRCYYEEINFQPECPCLSPSLSLHLCRIYRNISHLRWHSAESHSTYETARHLFCWCKREKSKKGLSIFSHNMISYLQCRMYEHISPVCDKQFYYSREHLCTYVSLLYKGLTCFIIFLLVFYLYLWWIGT